MLLLGYRRRRRRTRRLRRRCRCWQFAARSAVRSPVRLTRCCAFRRTLRGIFVLCILTTFRTLEIRES